jgi:DNA-directed RNA polymerase I, II, and III subunit RPABC5
MIIPIRCFTCSAVIADKYRYYLEEVRKKKLAINMNDTNLDKIVYLTKDIQDKTPEGEVLDEIGLTKMCCRRHFLTHVDID